MSLGATDDEIRNIQNEMDLRIPILKSLELKLQSLNDEHSLLRVPLSPNRNHKGTAFGGSLYASCTAGCYAFIY